VLSEFSGHGISSRFGKKRADPRHQWLDPVVVGAPWALAAGGIAAAALKALRKRTS
jgi:hypothetical protein